MRLTINGKEYPLEFGLGAIEIFCDKMDCDVSDIDEQITSSRAIVQIKAINMLTLCALQNGCELEGIPFDLSYRSLQKWLDSQSQEMASAIIAEWKNSTTLGRKVSEYYFNEVLPDEEANDSAGKKKPAVKKKSQSGKS